MTERGKLGITKSIIYKPFTLPCYSFYRITLHSRTLLSFVFIPQLRGVDPGSFWETLNPFTNSVTFSVPPLSRYLVLPFQSSFIFHLYRDNGIVFLFSFYFRCMIHHFITAFYSVNKLLYCFLRSSLLFHLFLSYFIIYSIHKFYVFCFV